MSFRARLKNRMGLRGRFVAVSVFLVLLQLGVFWIRRGYTMGEISPPHCDLRTLPVQLGAWIGTEVEQDPRLLGKLQALAAVNRDYCDAANNRIFVHLVWTDDYIRVHFPHQCYRETGWTETETKDFAIDGPDGRPSPVRLVTFERDAERIQVLYWFQMGDRLFFDRVQHRTLRQQLCWGRRQWPPLVKVMLQTSAGSAGEAETRLKELAEPVMAWLHEPVGEKDGSAKEAGENGSEGERKRQGG